MSPSFFDIVFMLICYYRSLPDECEVTDPDIVDDSIREYYVDLPPLK